VRKDQTAESRPQRAESKEQRADSREQTADSREQTIPVWTPGDWGGNLLELNGTYTNLHTLLL
jgi:hypothetical protein